jgi:hypothetical protein
MKKTVSNDQKTLFVQIQATLYLYWFCASFYKVGLLVFVQEYMHKLLRTRDWFVQKSLVITYIYLL